MVSILHGVHCQELECIPCLLLVQWTAADSSGTVVFNLTANVWFVFQQFRNVNYIYYLRKGKYVFITV
jgi:hypothetical protein